MHAAPARPQSLRSLIDDLDSKCVEIVATGQRDLIERAASALNDVLIDAGRRAADRPEFVARCRHDRPGRSCPWCRHLHR